MSDRPRDESKHLQSLSGSAGLAIVICVDLLLVLLLFLFLLPVVPGFTQPRCGPAMQYSNDRESVSFGLFGVGTVYEFGHYVWAWHPPFIDPRYPCF